MRTSTEEDDAPLADCPTAANHVALAATSVLEPRSVTGTTSLTELDSERGSPGARTPNLRIKWLG